MAEIELRAIEEEDLDTIQWWRNSLDVMPFCRQYRPLSHNDMEKWFFDLRNDSDYNLSNDLLMIDCDTKSIGVGGFVRIDWRNRKAELSFYVGEKLKEHRKIVKMVLLCLMDYAFKTLGMHKVYFPVYSFNPNLELYEEILKREYIAKKEYYWDGKFHDRVVLVAYNDSI